MSWHYEGQGLVPEPGTLDIIRHGILRRAIRGKRLLISWPIGRLAKTLASLLAC